MFPEHLAFGKENAGAVGELFISRRGGSLNCVKPSASLNCFHTTSSGGY